ncbi:unnamed protein product, partial [Lymnaea stagnalis]
MDTLLKQQLEILKIESDTVKNIMDEFVNKIHLSVRAELDHLTSTGQLNHVRFQEVYKNIQQAITFVIMKTFEISEVNVRENDVNPHSLSESVVSLKKTSTAKTDTTQATLPSNDEKRLDKSVLTVDIQNMTRRMTVLEEAVVSMKNTTNAIQEKQDNADKLIKEISGEKKEILDKVLNDV